MPSSKALPDPGIEPMSAMSPALWANSLLLSYQGSSYHESESESRSVMSDFLQTHGLYSPWNSPDQNTGVGSLSLLQGIFPTQGSNPGLPHCRQILYQLSHKGSPILTIWFVKMKCIIILCIKIIQGEDALDTA